MGDILLVEDCTDLQVSIVHMLKPHKVHVVNDPDHVLNTLSVKNIVLVILDIGLPKRDGYSVLAEIKSSRFKKIPVICLTGRCERSDRIAAFTLGADDFIVKPFDHLEFQVRIESKLRNGRVAQADDIIYVGKLKLAIFAQRVYTLDDKEIPLTQTEFKILACLCKNPGSTVNRQTLARHALGDEESSLRAIDVHICSLRKKTQSHGIAIKSVFGIGYSVVLIDN